MAGISEEMRAPRAYLEGLFICRKYSEKSSSTPGVVPVCENLSGASRQKNLLRKGPYAGSSRIFVSTVLGVRGSQGSFLARYMLIENYLCLESLEKRCAGYYLLRDS